MKNLLKLSKVIAKQLLTVLEDLLNGYAQSHFHMLGSLVNLIRAFRTKAYL